MGDLTVPLTPKGVVSNASRRVGNALELELPIGECLEAMHTYYETNVVPTSLLPRINAPGSSPGNRFLHGH